MPGWSLYRGRGERTLLPFCNPHADSPACEGWPRLSLEDRSAYEALFAQAAPPLVIHCGGVCDVERCEASPAWARRVNVESVGHFLDFLPRTTRLVYVSSDHVFGGREEPYDEDAPPEPLSVYGKTRVEAEALVLSRRPDALVIRYALGIGPSVDGRTGHLNWLQYRSRKGLPITIVEGEYRSAVWASDLAERVFALADSGLSGIRHVTADRAVSRVELARSLNERYSIGAHFHFAKREDRPAPHLGRVALATRFQCSLAAPLASVCPSGH